METGEKYGSFAVVAPAPSKHGHAYVLAACTCGHRRVVRASWLRRGVKCSACGTGSSAWSGTLNSVSGTLNSVSGTLDEAMTADLKGFLALEIDARFDEIKDMLDGLKDLLGGFKSPAPAPAKSGGLKGYSLSKPTKPAQPSTPAEPKLDSEAWLADVKKRYLTGYPSREAAHEENTVRALELANTPLDEQTPEMRNELNERVAINIDRLDYMLPSDPPYAALHEANLIVARALRNWGQPVEQD